jgi:hypothetical protein
MMTLRSPRPRVRSQPTAYDTTGRWGGYHSLPVHRTYDSRVSFDLAQVMVSCEDTVSSRGTLLASPP